MKIVYLEIKLVFLFALCSGNDSFDVETFPVVLSKAGERTKKNLEKN